MLIWNVITSNSSVVDRFDIQLFECQWEMQLRSIYACRRFQRRRLTTAAEEERCRPCLRIRLMMTFYSRFLVILKRFVWIASGSRWQGVCRRLDGWPSGTGREISREEGHWRAGLGARGKIYAVGHQRLIRRLSSRLSELRHHFRNGNESRRTYLMSFCGGWKKENRKTSRGDQWGVRRWKRGAGGE